MKTTGLFFMAICLAQISAFAGAGQINPPWTKTPEGGVEFTVPGVNNTPDLNGDIVDPDLVVFFGGNQFMVLPEIMEAFREQYPENERIFYETLPPGIIEKQLRLGSLVMGNLRIEIKPDVFVAGEERIGELNKEGFFASTRPYLRNRLAIMVAEGNPKEIRSLTDLGKDDVNVSMPNQETEGIAEKVMVAYENAGGEDLVHRIMETKKENGTTFITQIHHRQTPMRILGKKSDAGPVWVTEVLFQQRIENPVELVEIPQELNETGTFSAAILADAPNQQAAENFVEFLAGETAAEIYRKYGFEPIVEEEDFEDTE